MKEKYSLEDLRYLMTRLRDPDFGCPWDQKQTYHSIIPHTLEEVYEVIDAVENLNFVNLQNELGDLLFQIVFLCHLAEEDKYFNLDDVINLVTGKLLRRHPHVFPDGSLVSKGNDKMTLSSSDIADSWEEIKKNERKLKGKVGFLDDIPNALPANKRAMKLQKRASNIGFDWESSDDVLNKVYEELSELEQEMELENSCNLEDELGDLMFTIINLSRHLQIDPESALRKANQKFTMRLNSIEKLAPQNDITKLSQHELGKMWLMIKSQE